MIFDIKPTRVQEIPLRETRREGPKPPQTLNIQNFFTKNQNWKVRNQEPSAGKRDQYNQDHLNLFGNNQIYRTITALGIKPQRNTFFSDNVNRVNRFMNKKQKYVIIS